MTIAFRPPRDLIFEVGIVRATSQDSSRSVLGRFTNSTVSSLSKAIRSHKTFPFVVSRSMARCPIENFQDSVSKLLEPSVEYYYQLYVLSVPSKKTRLWDSQGLEPIYSDMSFERKPEWSIAALLGARIDGDPTIILINDGTPRDGIEQVVHRRFYNLSR